MRIRYRRAKPGEICRAHRMLEPERPLYSPAVWSQLPQVLDDLRSQDRILLCIVEDDRSGEALFVGASGFVGVNFLEDRLVKGKGILNAALALEQNGHRAFLNYNQVAVANREADLRLLNFLGSPTWVDLKDSNTLQILKSLAGDPILTRAMDAWSFFHKGYRLCEVWLDSCLPLMIDVHRSLGSTVRQERPIGNGSTAKLVCYTRTQALAEWPSSFLASVMLTPPPRFCFSRAEQQLLELALLDYSDRDAVCDLGLSGDGVKKRWRSIYAKVCKSDPALLRSDLAAADQRRALLQFLRGNLQELRPYKFTSE